MSALLRKLERFGPLDRDERAAIERLCDNVVHCRPDDEVGRGGPAGTVPVVLNGFAFRARLLSDGRRQIQRLFIPGDLCRHIDGFLLPQSDDTLQALTAATVAMIPGASLAGLLEGQPRIARAFRAQSVVADAIQDEWVTSLGRRTAYERMAHLFCETFLRLRGAGLSDHNHCELPLTQTDLGDIAGLSTVHVNRVLQQLRRDGLIMLRGSSLTIPDVAQLLKAADLDPSYLQIEALPDPAGQPSDRASAA